MKFTAVFFAATLFAFATSVPVDMSQPNDLINSIGQPVEDVGKIVSDAANIPNDFLNTFISGCIPGCAKSDATLTCIPGFHRKPQDDGCWRCCIFP